MSPVKRINKTIKIFWSKYRTDIKVGNEREAERRVLHYHGSKLRKTLLKDPGMEIYLWPQGQAPADFFHERRDCYVEAKYGGRDINGQKYAKLDYAPGRIVGVPTSNQQYEIIKGVEGLFERGYVIMWVDVYGRNRAHQGTMEIHGHFI